jgi:hypothetical protein
MSGFIALISHDSELEVITASSLISIFTVQLRIRYELPACYVFTISFLATASNSGDYLPSRAKVLPSTTPVQNCLSAIPSTELNRHFFSANLAELNCTQHSTLTNKIVPIVSLITTLHDRTENTIFNNNSSVAWVRIASERVYPVVA